MPRETVQFARKPDGKGEPGIGRIEAHFLNPHILHAAAPAEEIAGEQPHHVFGQA